MVKTRTLENRKGAAPKCFSASLCVTSLAKKYLEKRLLATIQGKLTVASFDLWGNNTFYEN